jgi:predicted ATPase/DNA-binding XRE family transcriptional regulator
MHDDRGKDPNFGALLRRYREAVGWSQEELAECAGLSAKAISALERGERRRPYPATVQRLVAALDLTDADRTALLESLRSHESAATEADADEDERISAVALRPAPLPSPLTPLIGREDELAAVTALLGASERLVTLAGPGGVGKTRLAIEAARALGAAFPDGLVFVPLAPLTDAALVLPTIAETIGLRETGHLSGQALLSIALRSRRVLLVLDNCEHVLGASREIAALLEACPQLAVLATGREPLRLRGERVFLLAPLAVPALAAVSSLSQVARSPAAQLFVQRAQAASLTFTLAPENAAAVAAICRRLDGLPLALELAAARITLLGPTALLARLDRVLPILTGGARDLPARQRTLRDAISWSFDLLEDDEKLLLRRLAVFAGGCTLEAAAAVCGEPPDPTRESAILAGITSLLDKSLVERDDTTEMPRVRMLEMLREFGWEQMARAGEDKAIRRRHALYYLDLVETTQPKLLKGDPYEILRLDLEHDNVRASLRWAQESGAVEVGLRLAGSFRYLWQARGYLSEGRSWLQLFLDTCSGNEEPGLRAKALNGAGGLANLQRDYWVSTRLYEDSLALYRSIGDSWGEAALLVNLSYAVAALGDDDRATNLLEQGLDLAQRMHHPEVAGTAIGYLAMAAQRRGDWDRAVALYERSIAILVELEEPWWINMMVTQLGDLRRQMGDYDRAATLLERSLALSRELGDRQSIGTSLCHLGQLLHEREEEARATRALLDALGLLQSLGDLVGVARCLERLAGIAGGSGRYVAAARLGGAAEALRALIRVPAMSAERAETERGLSAARDALGAQDFALAWEEGTVLEPDRAAEELRDSA